MAQQTHQSEEMVAEELGGQEKILILLELLELQIRVAEAEDRQACQIMEEMVVQE